MGHTDFSDQGSLPDLRAVCSRRVNGRRSVVAITTEAHPGIANIVCIPPVGTVESQSIYLPGEVPRHFSRPPDWLTCAVVLR